MNMRTVIFVLLVGASFFGLNLYFNSQRDQENRAVLLQHQEREKQGNEEITADIQKRTESINNLPIVPIFLDKETSEPIAYGIDVNGNTIALAWEDSLPTKIYVKGKEQNLMTKNTVYQGAVVYASPSFTHFDIAALPEIGTYDVQLITLPKGEMPRVYLGELINQTLHIPGTPPTENALALYKTENGWLPLGFYEWRSRSFIELQNLPILSEVAKQIKSTPTVAEATGKKILSKQNYFVLENDYQQLVFSNVGGALVEINLPFHSDSNTSSVVNEIGFDREIAKDYPANAHFPAHPYYRPNTQEEQLPSTLGGYYPLLRRGIWNGKTTEILPMYYAFNIVSEYPEMAELVYEVKEFTNNKIVFEAIQPHRRITKTYMIENNHTGAPYCFDLTIQIDGDSRGLWLTSGVPEVEIMSNSSSPQIQYRIERKGKSDVEKLDLPKPKEMITLSSVHPDWVANSNGYFGIIMDPKDEVTGGYRVAGIPGTQAPTRLSIIDPQYDLYPAADYPAYQVLLPLPSRGGTLNFRAFSGPFEESILKKVDKIYSDPVTGYNPDYIACRTFYGWFSFISEPFAKILFVVMKFFYNLTGSWGFAIILLTVFLRVILYPLNAWSFKSTRRMQQLTPQIQAIQKRLKKDPKKSQMEIMALYREKKVNPFTGCIPILIQIPFLIAMFDLLKSSFQLRGASFIPGWIDNLTAPDVIFQWDRPIFFIGNQLHLLPILLGGVMFLQQRLFSTAPSDPAQMTDQQRQQKAMGTIMTVVFAVMFYHFPSGLNIYWLSSMLLGILQQTITNKVLDKKQNSVEVIVPNEQKKTSIKKAK